MKVRLIKHYTNTRFQINQLLGFIKYIDGYYDRVKETLDPNLVEEFNQHRWIDAYHKPICDGFETYLQIRKAMYFWNQF